MNLSERLQPVWITPGTMSSARERHNLWMRLHRVGGVALWVRLALRAELSASVVGAVPR